MPDMELGLEQLSYDNALTIFWQIQIKIYVSQGAGSQCMTWLRCGENQWIWAFGTNIGVEPKFQKTTCPDMSSILRN